MVMLVIAFVVAIGGALVITPLVTRAARRANFYDRPLDARRVHTKPVPRLGGVAVHASSMLGVMVAAVYGLGTATPGRVQFFAALALGGFIVFATGVVDDLRGITAQAKFVATSAAALVAYSLGLRIGVLSLGPAGEIALGWLSLPVTLCWIVGVTNAFNLIDGLDGLASGVAAVVLSTILVAALVLGNADVALVCIALLGAVIGFLRYNVNPATIFLGDSGSLFIGFMLAVLSVHGSLKSTTAVLVAIPVFALAIPLLDVSLAILRRWLRGAPIFSADARHLHHRLLAIGLAPTRAAGVLCASAALFAVLGLVLAFAPTRADVSVALAGSVVALALVLYGVRRLNYLEFIEAGAAFVSGVPRVRRVIRDQICAREIAQLIPFAETMVHLNAILTDRVDDFGFMRMQVDCAESPVDNRLRRTPSGAFAWQLEYPVTPTDQPDRDQPDREQHVLRISCDPASSFRPLGAERVARVLAPTIERWLRKQYAPDADVRHDSHVVPIGARAVPTPASGGAERPVRPAATLAGLVREIGEGTRATRGAVQGEPPTLSAARV